VADGTAGAGASATGGPVPACVAGSRAAVFFFRRLVRFGLPGLTAGRSPFVSSPGAGVADGSAAGPGVAELFAFLLRLTAFFAFLGFAGVPATRSVSPAALVGGAAADWSLSFAPPLA
jgi:hypothetical protein